MPSITTVLSPALFEHAVTDVDKKTVIIIDILRATTTIVVAMENGAKSILPVEELSVAANAGESFLKAAERQGQKVEGFDMGNSPKEYTQESVSGRDIVLTTTNGTRAIARATGAKEILIASYRNLLATYHYLVSQQCDLVLFCSGWKNQTNIEDTLFAGELASMLVQTGFDTDNDATHLAVSLFENHKNNEKKLLNQASHVKRFEALGVNDLDVCLMRDTYAQVLKVHDGVIKNPVSQ